MRKLPVCAIVICMLLSLCLSVVTAADPVPVAVIEQGNCGDSLAWALYDDGQLVISGSGSMDAFSSGTGCAPWCTDHAADVRTVVIEEGVESIGAYAFYYCANLESVEIASTVESIGTLAFCGCSSLGSVVIPEGIYSIEQSTFYGCSSLERVSLPSTLQSIRWYAFLECSSLKSIVLPSELSTIGYQAFASCTSLESINIPFVLTSIQASAFDGCTALTDVIMGSRTQTFADGVFNGCTALTDVYYIGTDENWQSISFGADNSALSGLDTENHLHLIDASDVVTVTAEAEYGKALASKTVAVKGMSLNVAVTPDEGFEFSFMTADHGTAAGNALNVAASGDFTSVAVKAICIKSLPGNSDESVVAYGNCGPGGMDNVKWKLLSDGTLYFQGTNYINFYTGGGPWKTYAEDITRVVLQHGVTGIGQDALRDLPNLTCLMLPSTMEYVYDYSVYNDAAISDVFYVGTEETWQSINFTSKGNYRLTSAPRHYISSPNDVVSVSVTACEHAEVHVPSMAERGGSFTVTVTPEIGYALYGITATNSTVEGNVVTVSSGDFWNVDVSVTMESLIPGETIKYSGACNEKVNWILTEEGTLLICGEGAMPDYSDPDAENPAPWIQYYVDIDKISVGEGVTAIGANAFCNCYYATRADMPTTLLSIGAQAFYNCTRMQYAAIPSGVTSIGAGGFRGCSFLKSVTIPSGVTTISAHAFHGCQKITSITVPASVTDIGEYAFYNCTALETVVLPDTMNSIGDNAFGYCDVLSSIRIPDGVTRIGSSAFFRALALEEITIPHSVTSIGYQAFYFCEKIKAIYYYGTADNWQRDVTRETGAFQNWSYVIHCLDCKPDGSAFNVELVDNVFGPMASPEVSISYDITQAPTSSSAGTGSITATYVVKEKTYVKTEPVVFPACQGVVDEATLTVDDGVATLTGIPGYIMVMRAEYKDERMTGLVLVQAETGKSLEFDASDADADARYFFVINYTPVADVIPEA